MARRKKKNETKKQEPDPAADLKQAKLKTTASQKKDDVPTSMIVPQGSFAKLSKNKLNSMCELKGTLEIQNELKGEVTLNCHPGSRIELNGHTYHHTNHVKKTLKLYGDGGSGVKS